MAFESGLSAVYDALDSQHFEEAKSLCAKLLQKHPDSTIVKALLSYALQRLGKSTEALPLCNAVKATGPTDENILHAVNLALRHMNNYQAVSELYGTAYRKVPHNEEFGNLWFMGLVKTRNAKAMQQAALQLYKQFKDDKYLFWTIMCYYLQSLSSPATSETTLCFTLASRMIQKALSQDKVTNPETFHLLVTLLTSTSTPSTTADLLALVKDSLMDKVYKVPSDKRSAALSVFLTQKDWDSAAHVCKEQLLESPDDWYSWKTYTHAQYELGASQDSMHKSREQVQKFIENIAAVQAQLKIPPRGPFLATLEMEIVFDSGVSRKACQAYIERFGTTYCCFDDIKSYLQTMPKADAAALYRDSDVACTGIKFGQDIDLLKRDVNLEKLAFALKGSDRFPLVDSLLAKYQAALPLGKDLVETERQYSDDYATLAVHQLLIQWQASKRKTKKYLFQALVLLELALQRSKFNFQIKLLLIRIYLLLGVHERALDQVQSLEIKQMQHDTLSYLYLSPLKSLGVSPSTLLSLYASTLSIYASNERETPEMLCQAYRFGTFSKIEEFMRFYRRLAQSLVREVVTQERNALLVREASSGWQSIIASDQERPFKPTDLVDNRDYTVMASWHQPLPDVPVMEVLTRPMAHRDGDWCEKTRLEHLVLHGFCAGDSALTEKAVELEPYVHTPCSTGDELCAWVLCHLKESGDGWSTVMERLQEYVKSFTPLTHVWDLDFDLLARLSNGINACHYLALVLTSSRDRAPTNGKARALGKGHHFKEIKSVLKPLQDYNSTLLEQLLPAAKPTQRAAFVPWLAMPASLGAWGAQEEAQELAGDVLDECWESWEGSLQEFKRRLDAIFNRLV